MRRTALWTSVLATSFGMALAAQSTTGTQTGSQMGSQSGSTMRDSSSKNITISGCVERGDRAGEFKLTNLDRSGTGSASGTTGMSGTSGTSGSGTGAASGTTGSATSGTTGSATSATSGSGTMSGDWGDASSAHEYQLRARGSSVRLDEHVGHKVEVTGTVANASASDHMGTSGSGSTSGSGTMTTPSAGSTSGTQGSSGTATGSGAGTMGSTGTSGSSSNSRDTKGKTLEVSSLRMVSSSCTK